MAAASEYDPSKTKINEDTLGEWLRTPVGEDLTSVPGVGNAAITRFETVGITNTFQLIGQFLLLKGNEGIEQHMNAFFTWLKDAGVNAHRHTICLALAEKCDIFMPGIYDAELYGQ
eukprot:CAMPEP_0185780070 /NCGR_PEP_ID=MMETSP1174-20130828/97899_1 /TAXON_ID=35687 /ORGANISM="Dictyocha speculum, Strain CCMP1381" /LENGTH=115 /DNA_ID=CAMNT_0028469469 /DNA_START=28 /DNA_END=375 /DNA_ORIENTATION=+